MRLAALSLLGLAIGLVWSASALGECDRADCGPFWGALYETAGVGFTLLVASLVGLVVALGLAVWPRHRSSPDPTAQRRPAWPWELATTSVGLIAAFFFGLGGLARWSGIAVAIEAGALAYGIAHARSRH